MARVTVRPQAHRDLADIWNYTVQKWGEVQADDYLRTLGSCFQQRDGIARHEKSWDLDSWVLGLPDR